MWQTLTSTHTLTVSNGLLNRVIFLVNADRMRWLSGYGGVVGTHSTSSIPRSSFNNFFLTKS